MIRCMCLLMVTSHAIAVGATADLALDILELLTRRGAVVTYTDPYVPTLSHSGRLLESSSWATRMSARSSPEPSG